MALLRKAAFGTLIVALGAIAYLIGEHGIVWYQTLRRTYTLRGAVIKQSADARNESPIENVKVSVDDGVAVAGAESDFSGYFVLPLRRGIQPGDPITLHFRHPDYEPVDQKETAGDLLDVVRMRPIHGEVEADLDLATLT